MGGLAYLALANRPAFLLGAEILLLLSALIAYSIYRRLIAPVRLLGQGVAALEDQDFSVKLVPTGSREMDGLVNVYNTMIDQLRTERVSGRQREEFLDRLIGAADLGVAVLDYEGVVEQLNPWLRARYANPDFRAAVVEPYLGARVELDAVPVTVTGPGGRRYRVERSAFVDRGFERGFLVINDVTATLVTAEKDAYGKVIRMMAHEVNNTNAAVGSILRSLLAEAADDATELGEVSRDFLPAVIDRSDRLTEFMAKLARVVRIPHAQRQPVDLNELLRRCGELMTPLLADSDVELEYDLDFAPVLISGDAALLEQVVINTLTNARQSLADGGVIRLETRRGPAGFVVADNGPGIPEEYADRLFTPFFSSKPNGQGIGLTLAREVLTAHDATFQLNTEADGWTRFRVSFPS